MPEITVESARAHIAEALEQYVRCPAESDFESGYLAALYVIGTEALGMKFDGHAPIVPPERKVHLSIVK